MKTKLTTSQNKATSVLVQNWIPRKEVKDFFYYGNTKMSSFSKDFNVRTAKVGKRVFYLYEDIVRLFESNI
tara:strand:- start:409 stop:621 length:213 start_codon:yes stop_codon:yes gene_type:complete